MNTINYTAVRAFNRAIQPYAEAEAMGAYADHQFDGGEWSDAQHAYVWEKTRHRVALRVGRRFNLGPTELLDMADVAVHIEHDHFLEQVQS